MPLSRAFPGRPARGRLLLGASAPWWHRSRRRTGRWLLAFGLAGIAAGFVAVRADESARTLAGLGRTRSVLVARRDLAPGDVVGDGDVVERDLPVDALPDSSADGSGDRSDDGRGSIDGRTVTALIIAGEVVSARRLAPAGVDGLAALVPPGRRAIAVPTEGTGLHLQVGDRVDVLGPTDATSYGDESATGVDPVATDALVIAVDDAATTIAVERGEAPSVARALAGGTPVLALTGAPTDPADPAEPDP